MNLAIPVLLNLVSSTQGHFFVLAFTQDNLEVILATDVLVRNLTGKIFGPVPTSHWVRGGSMIMVVTNSLSMISKGTVPYFHGQRS